MKKTHALRPPLEPVSPKDIDKDRDTPRYEWIVLIILAAVLLWAKVAHGQNLGRAIVTGEVTDNTGAALPGVTVTATRSGETSGGIVGVTEMDGTFQITDLVPGSYSIEANLDGFAPVSKQVTLVTGRKVQLALKLVPAFAETVTVVGTAPKTGEVTVLEDRRQAAVVSDSISAEEIRKTPDSSAASVVERLTGVTLLNDKFVFVRGLGERYSGTTINGASIATTETEKRVVPLDLFPAKLLDTVNVVKTYTPDKPGDFGSGVVEMTTTQFPAAQTFKVTLGTAHYSQATGNEFRRYAGGLNWIGEGGQPMPSIIPKEILRQETIFDPNGFTPAELATFGKALVGDWTGRPKNSAPPGTELSLTYGNTFGRLGVVMSGVTNHGYNELEEQQRFFGVDDGVLVPLNDYDLVTHRETVTSGLVGNFSLRLADSHRVFLNSVLTRDASGEDRVQEGLQTSSGGNVRDYRVRYQLEEILATRLRGEHNLSGPGVGSLLEWNVSRSDASNDTDLRENIYRESSPGVFTLETGLPDTGKLDFHTLDDQINQGGLMYTVFFAPSSGAWSGLLKGGVDRLDRDRDFQARRLRFVPGAAARFNPTDLPDQIFIPENIGPGKFEIREVTGVNDAYTADHTIDAAFLMTDFTRGRFRVIGGARYESSDQRVTTFDPFNVSTPVQAINENNDILPSVNFVYQIRPQTNIRLAYGRSVNRPEFRELSPFAFTEVAGGRSLAGNPNLVQATIDAVDARWELFPGAGEVVAASIFYKKIDKPIERIVQPTSDFRVSFANAESADLKGIELEFRRSLEHFFPALRLWSVNFNYAWIQSDVTLGEQQFSIVTSTERPLEGQSDQTGNVALQFYKPEWGTLVRVLASYVGERLVEVGALGLPDTFETANTSLDFVYTQSLGPRFKGLEVKLAATNLLDEAREYRQADAIQRRLQPGRKIGLLLSYSPF